MNKHHRGVDSVAQPCTVINSVCASNYLIKEILFFSPPLYLSNPLFRSVSIISPSLAFSNFLFALFLCHPPLFLSLHSFRTRTETAVGSYWWYEGTWPAQLISTIIARHSQLISNSSNVFSKLLVLFLQTNFTVGINFYFIFSITPFCSVPLDRSLHSFSQ